MGVQTVFETGHSPTVAFRQALLTDLQALEYMLEGNLLESDIVRTGAEQEMMLVDAACRPVPVAPDVLKLLSGSTFSPEMGKFNLEANIAPRRLTGDCLRAMETDLNLAVDQARSAAQQYGADVLLTGILPSVRLSDLGLHNLTDRPRYHELNRSVMSLRGGAYHLFIKGVDELQLIHDNVMLEASCTSFQVHLQVNPARFVTDYNASLLAAAPVLAVAVNSPMLLGRRLWQETRIAVFQHAVDERSHSHIARYHPTRVSFGENWVEQSVIEIYRDQIARFRDIMTTDAKDDALTILANGGVPELRALVLHNSTVWRWNRPCFGITDGKPHLRLEFRALPAGPTVLDEVANAALFLGLTKAISEEYGNPSALMRFQEVKDNFFAAARHGLKAQLTWVDGKHYSVFQLIDRYVLPLAERGLRHCAVDSDDIDRYLSVIRGRLDSNQTGSSWALAADSVLSDHHSQDARDRRLTAAMMQRQQSGRPVHQWPALTPEELATVDCRRETVGEIMSTDLFTVRPDDPITVAASFMDWRHIRHLPVEHDGHLIGLISSRDVLHYLASPRNDDQLKRATVEDLMNSKPLTVNRETPLQTALQLVLDNNLDCLPVTENDELIGLVTSKDLLHVLAQLLKNGKV